MYLSEEKEQEEKDVPDIDLEKEQKGKNVPECREGAGREGCT